MSRLLTFLQILLLLNGAGAMAAEKRLKFSPAIPVAQRDIMLRALNKVVALAAGLKFPDELEVVVVTDPDFVGAGSRLQERRLELSEVAFKLSDSAFEDMVIHELTHFLVGESFGLFRSSDAFVSLVQQHMPFAELISDVAAVTSSRRPTAFKDFIGELIILTANDAKASELLRKSLGDQPAALSRRDFSISHLDPRWAAYKPRDMTYNRFNQIRGYLWHRWIENLPADQAPVFIKKLIQALEPIFRSGQLCRMILVGDLFESNRVLIQYLESRLE